MYCIRYSVLNNEWNITGCQTKYFGWDMNCQKYLSEYFSFCLKFYFPKGIFPNGYFQNVQLSGGNFLSLSKPQCSALHPCSNSSDQPPPLLQPAAPQKAFPNRNEVAAWDITNLKLPLDKLLYSHKDLFTHKDINTYINGVV